MQRPSIEDMQLYLCENYLTLQQLADNCDVSTERIVLLEETQCIPAHSYEIRPQVNFHIVKFAYTANAPCTYYYHPSIKDWVLQAEKLAQTYSLTEVAKLIREKFNREFTHSFGAKTTPGCKGLDHAWAYLMNGTWGICLQELTVDCMMRKEFARQTIAECLQDQPKALSSSIRQRLIEAIETYLNAAMPFDPYLVEKSSRRCEIAAAVEKYQLPITGVI